MEEEFLLDPYTILYLPLYRLDGTSFMSQDHRGHLCTKTGAIWTPQGYSFDGTGDVITIPYTTSFDMTTMTAEAWAYVTAWNDRGIVAKRIEGVGNMWQLVNKSATNRFTFAVYIGGVYTACISATALSANNWYHVVGTSNGTDIRVYVNGNLNSTPVAGGNIDTGNCNITIGRFFNATYTWSSIIGEVRLYNRALTPQEIQDIFLQTRWRYS